ncbi:MAG: transcriptional regulator GcvA [Pseudomonadota bacterium]
MPKRLPPLNSLRAFEVAARHLSFTRAASELFVTQAAVSHQIKALEEFLGVKLFVRRNRALLLTEEGQKYYPLIRDIFEKLANATEQIKAGGASGALTVSVVPTFAIVWLVPRLSEFNERYPEIDVRLKAEDFEVDFLRDDIDLAIYYGDGYYGGQYSVRLLDEYLTPVCSPSLLGGVKPLNEPKDLAKHTLLHDASTEDWKRWLKIAKVNSIDLSHGPVFSHSSMVIQAAIHGQGVAMGHNVLSQADISAGRLVRPFDTVLPSECGYDLVCPETSIEQPKIRAFKEWLLEIVSKESAQDPFGK